MQYAHAPSRRKTKSDQKSQAGQPLRNCALAPTLEHGNQSNEKQDDSATGENLQKHDLSPPQLPFRNRSQFFANRAAARSDADHA
jgi:hypothetical protein